MYENLEITNLPRTVLCLALQYYFYISDKEYDSLVTTAMD